MNSKKLLKLLEKRAQGFTYKEVQEEFLIEKENFENTTGKEVLLTKENDASLPNKCEKNDDVKNEVQENYVVELQQKRGRGRPKKCETKSKQEKSKMVLVKKKVHTFFVPPDMIAIKMLFDMQDEKPKEVDDVMDLALRRKKLLDNIKRELIGEMEDED